jgi:hypothetical protein
LAKYLRKEGFSKSRNKIFLGNHLRERKDEVHRFLSYKWLLWVVLNYNFLRKQSEERERCKVRDIGVRVLR